MSESRDHGQSEDRRRFFRIDDALRLSWRIVSEADLVEGVRRLDQGLGGTYALMATLAGITQRMSVSLRRIEQHDADVADYLRALDQKIDAVARAVVADECDLARQPAEPVNLSAGGLAIQVREPIAPGTPLEVRLLLLPSMAGLLTYGQVLSCTPAGGEDGGITGGFQMRVDFTHIREQDRDLLVRHLLRRQGEYLRTHGRSGEGKA
jgi:hypothetical protein